ncbi:hypothetical protein [Actinacidiphila yeochonensis]|uniref:hypothetical protein n=1 Tax=Actinacidiphila yeochonensis TaxID=89050 RepID=UPI0012FEEA37|nr:hypothetical protein [Actinacidiphila yeochonensis]
MEESTGGLAQTLPDLRGSHFREALGFRAEHVVVGSGEFGRMLDWGAADLGEHNASGDAESSSGAWMLAGVPADLRQCLNGRQVGVVQAAAALVVDGVRTGVQVVGEAGQG